MVVTLFCLYDALDILKRVVTQHCEQHPDGDKIHTPVIEPCIVDQCEGFRIRVIQAPSDYSLVQAACGWHYAGTVSRISVH